MTSRDAISVELGPKLKRELKTWNFYHEDDKINYTQECRDALQNALNKKKEESV